jgi:hypothetical protein
MRVLVFVLLSLPLVAAAEEFTGTLVDASCDDRSALNLRQRPTPPVLATAPQQSAGAAGIHVDSQTLRKERADVLAHQTPDLLMRQRDRSCAVTGATRQFALLLPSGRLLNLDEGGTTLVWQSLNGLPEGRALLNGTGPAVKPEMKLRGRVKGDRLIVEEVAGK